MMFSEDFKVFSLGSSHSICVDLQKRPNMQERQERVSKGHCCSYTTWEFIDPVCICVGKTQRTRWGITLCAGEILDEKQCWGEDVFPRLIRRQSLCFGLVLEISKKHFVAQPCRSSVVTPNSLEEQFQICTPKASWESDVCIWNPSGWIMWFNCKLCLTARWSWETMEKNSPYSELTGLEHLVRAKRRRRKQCSEKRLKITERSSTFGESF